MSRSSGRWPIWKFAIATAGCAAAAIVFFWVSFFMSAAVTGKETDPSSQAALLTLPGFIMILGVAASMLTVLCLVWLIVRVREARMPSWERRDRRRKRR